MSSVADAMAPEQDDQLFMDLFSDLGHGCGSSASAGAVQSGCPADRSSSGAVSPSVLTGDGNASAEGLAAGDEEVSALLADEACTCKACLNTSEDSTGGRETMRFHIGWGWGSGLGAGGCGRGILLCQSQALIIHTATVQTNIAQSHRGRFLLHRKTVFLFGVSP